jgi:hypothetical protein
MSESEISKLRELFYNKKSVLKPTKFYELAEEAGINRRTVKEFFENQEITQITKGYKAPNKFHHILAFQPMDRVYLDTMFIKRYKVAIVVIMDLFSKYAYAHMFSNTLKDDGITSQKALDAFKFFMEDIKKHGYGSVGRVEHDDGSEFKGVFKSYMIANSIESNSEPESIQKAYGSD